jgi:hypothetical protein
MTLDLPLPKEPVSAMLCPGRALVDWGCYRCGDATMRIPSSSIGVGSSERDCTGGSSAVSVPADLAGAAPAMGIEYHGRA